MINFGTFPPDTKNWSILGHFHQIQKSGHFSFLFSSKKNFLIPKDHCWIWFEFQKLVFGEKTVSQVWCVFVGPEIKWYLHIASVLLLFVFEEDPEIKMIFTLCIASLYTVSSKHWACRGGRNTKEWKFSISLELNNNSFNSWAFTPFFKKSH